MIINRPSKTRGFTLLEVIIASAIVVVVGWLIVNFGIDLAVSNIRFNGSLLTQAQIHQTLQIMVPEIRSASQSNGGAYPIATAGTSTLIFYSDIDRDGLFERVRYFLNGSTFSKGVIKPTGTPFVYPTSTEVVYDLVNTMIPGTIFAYYDEDARTSTSTPLSQPVDILRIKMVRITLIANQGTTSTPSIVGVEDQATVRNLRYD